MKSRLTIWSNNRKSVETMDVDKAMHLAQMAATRAVFERYLIEPVEG